ncbi:hypothetical protein SAMN05421681_101619 [Lysobacter enzymogenes]|jgi:hypothetical protein|uniref:Cobalamin transporter n=2 Tax=Lysobacter enzymogenes TaxID=69 RepID=A0AAU9APC1_LYSEN|nr:conserved hypothetical protein [Lysobacter enzymogenes]SDW28817.1 hypothetical protein SAMN05421681_101619 [Lysobacter enzymogenes]
MTWMLPPSEAALPLRSRNAQIAAALALAALMVCTRGQHFATVDALPSASWAVFFLAGALLRPAWLFPALFVLSSLLDLASLALGRVTDWCLSPAYWALALAYGALWWGGRVYARMHRDRIATVPVLVLSLLAISAVAYLISKGGFYFLSGRYPDATWAGFLDRIPRYYPRTLGTLAGYVGAGFVVYAVARLFESRQRAGAAA